MTRDTNDLLKTLLNKLEDDAIKLIKQSGYTPRCVRRDDTDYFLTQDLNFSRINYTIRDNFIINTFIG